MSLASSPREPSRARLANPFMRYLLATRPAFLSITLAGCLLGFATARADGVPFDGVRAAITLLLAGLAHAGINVLNETGRVVGRTPAYVNFATQTGSRYNFGVRYTF